MIILENLSRASSLLSTVAYPAADAAVAFTAMYLVVQDKRTIHKQLASSFLHIASAFLIILAASHYSGWIMTLNQVASLALPLLAVHPSGYTNFQLANALGIYRLLNNKGNPLQSALGILLHIYLVFANLNLSNQMQLASIMREISFAQVRQLNALQKLRELTINDLWQLPERYQLRNAYSDLVINTTESFFLHKAIFRMVWKPLIPIQVARMLFQLLPIFRSIFNGHIYQCLDSSDSGGYYKAYMAAAGLILVEFLEGQKCYLRGFTTKEEDRMKGVLKLELARLPLIHSGLKKTPTQWEMSVLAYVVDQCIALPTVVPYIITTFASTLPIYNMVGMYAFIPLVASSCIYTLMWIADRFIGDAREWNPKSGGYYPGDDVDSIYFNAKTVKMFGWESMYLDPKLKKVKEYFNRPPRYAPLVRLLIHIMEVMRTVATDLSMYITVAMYLQSLSATDDAMTNSKLLEMADHIDSLRLNIIHIYYGALRLTSLSRYNNCLEPLFRCKKFDTISHVKLGESETVPSIHLDNCSFRWTKNVTILKNVTFNATGKELVAVVGKTGSGKTSLLLAMCRELEITRGTGTISGRIGYLEQSPWIMNDTMRANILFGREFDEEYYWKVVHACALTQDIELWPERDLSLIGERGINISGGQRARLALARTVYSRADFYILDDPLSAVDAHVKRHILDNVILSSGLLGNALRIVTTHSESMLPFCDQIVTISGKTVSVVRQEPKEHLYIAPVTVVKPNNATDSTPKETNLATVPATPTIDGDNTKSDTIKAKPVAAANPTPAKKETLPKKHTILENAKYVFGLCGWHAIATFVITASFRPLSNFVLDKYNIAALKENAKYSSVSHEAVLWYLKVRLFKNATSEILDRIENYIGLMLSGDRIEDAIQTKFVYSLLHAPLSFLEKANRFKISAAYNEGSGAMAHGIPRYLRTESANTFESMISLWRSAQATPQFMLIVPFIVWARTRASRIADTTSESLSSIEKEASSRHSQTSSIIKDGSRMIRLFGVESYYMSRYISDKDEEAQIDCPKDSLERLSEIVSNGIRDSGKLISLISIIIQSHLTKYKVSSGQLNVLRADVADLIYNTGMLVEMPSRLRKFSNEIGTFRQFSDLDPEAPYIVEDCRMPSEWPHSGNVEFKNLSVKYGADQDYALKNLNITIRPGEKIGIVGRTGAGKSTLAKTLFRLLDSEVEGSIEIDGHDTAQFGVGDFRPKLGIIPQESTMFYGTVRRNLDPLNEFTIEDMWAAMIKCGVAELIEPKRKRKSTGLAKELVSSGSKGKDKDGGKDKDEDKDEDEEADRLRWEKAGLLMRAVLFLFASKKPKAPSAKDTKVGVNLTLGPNDSRFSGGQRQLFSLCRLLMRKRKVLILDEATAEVDLETDRKMQELIRSEFSECTVLTIAHRLDTIMNSDRIIVMEKGEIAEIGPPHELIANGGMFAELVKANEF